MKKLQLTILFLTWIISPFINNLYAQDQVIINITGRINKFVKIVASNNNSYIDLESIYNMETGELPSSNFNISYISAYSNSSEGYKMIIETTNNFNMTNSDGLSIPYTLNFDGAESTPTNAFMYEVASNNETIINTSGGSTFTKNQLINSNLTLKTITKDDFVINNDNFSDSIKIRIVSN